jgi:excisionase family DNA binding protein
VTIPNPTEQPTMTVEAAGSALGISRSTAYEAVTRGEIPSIRVGRRLLVPTAAVRRMLLLDQTGDPAA